jgi:hypothetical protein
MRFTAFLEQKEADMSITNVASSFSYLPPVLAVAPTATTQRVIEAAATSESGDQDERSDDPSQRGFPAQLASAAIAEAASRPAPGLLVQLQAENGSRGSVDRATVAGAYHTS